MTSSFEDTLSSFISVLSAPNLSAIKVDEQRQVIANYLREHDPIINILDTAYRALYVSKMTAGNRLNPANAVSPTEGNIQEAHKVVEDLNASLANLVINTDDIFDTWGDISAENLFGLDMQRYIKQNKTLIERISLEKKRQDGFTRTEIAKSEVIKFINDGIFSILKFISSSETAKNVQFENLAKAKQNASVQESKKNVAENMLNLLKPILSKEEEASRELIQLRHASDEARDLGRLSVKQMNIIRVLLTQLTALAHREEGVDMREERRRVPIVSYRFTAEQTRLVQATIPPLIRTRDFVKNASAMWIESADLEDACHRLVGILTMSHLEMMKKMNKISRLVVEKRSKIGNKEDRVVMKCPFVGQGVAENGIRGCWQCGDVLDFIASEKNRDVVLRCCDYHRDVILKVYEGALKTEVYDVSVDRAPPWTLTFEKVWRW